MTQLQPRHHYYVLGFVSAVAALHIFGAGAPYLYAQTSDVVSDTVLTQQAPQDPLPVFPPRVITKPSAPTKEAIRSKELTPEKRMQKMITEYRLLVRKFNRNGCTEDAKHLQKEITDGQSLLQKKSVDDTASAPIEKQAGIVKKICDDRLRARGLERQLNALEQLLKQVGTIEGLDTAALAKRVADMRAALESAKKDMVNHDEQTEKSVDEKLGRFETTNPADIEQLIKALRDLHALTKLVKNTEVQGQVKEILAPVLAAINEGQFVKARKLMELRFKELVSITKLELRAQRGRPVHREQAGTKLKELREKLKKQPVSSTEPTDTQPSVPQTVTETPIDTSSQ